MSDIFNALAAPFPVDAISWRVGSTKKDKSAGMALAYIDARDVMERLDEVVGPDGWERRHPHVEKTTTCELAIWIEGRGWVVKTDGAGDTDMEAEKGSLSDSFKRAAVNWGVGRYLYSLKSPWVDLESFGNSHRMKAGQEGKLRAVLVEHERAWSKANGAKNNKRADAPAQRSGAVVAGEASLIMCRTVADHDEWGAKNKAALEEMTPSDRAHLVAMWKRGRAAAVEMTVASFDPDTIKEFA